MVLVVVKMVVVCCDGGSAIVLDGYVDILYNSGSSGCILWCRKFHWWLCLYTKVVLVYML